jgi:hypothetical protein
VVFWKIGNFPKNHPQIWEEIEKMKFFLSPPTPSYLVAFKLWYATWQAIDFRYPVVLEIYRLHQIFTLIPKKILKVLI